VQRPVCFRKLCDNDLLRRSLYILKCGLVSIGKLTYQMIALARGLTGEMSKWVCVFGKGNHESSNPPTKKRKIVVLKPLNRLQGLVIKLQLRTN